LMMLRITNSISFAPPKCSTALLFDLEHIVLGSCLETIETLSPEFYTVIAIACFDNLSAILISHFSSLGGPFWFESLGVVDPGLKAWGVVGPKNSADGGT